MGSGNLSNSDSTSSEEEIDQQQPDKVSDVDMDDTTGVGRSYECTFCKRGFTNAQALGGHMNIHRKDKAKLGAKSSKSKSKDKNYDHHQESSSTLLSNKSKSYALVTSDDDDIEQQQYAASVGAYMGYQVYYPAISNYNNPSYYNNLHGYHHHHYDFMTTSSAGVPADQSLNLRIGTTLPPPPHNNNNNNNNNKEEDDESLNKTDIDLELRLGH